MQRRASSLRVRRMIFSALYLAIAMVLPFLTGQIPEIGRMLCPMHIPVLLCGMVCGWPYGLAVGLIAPIMRSLLCSMPRLYPDAVAMTFELGAYGAFSGLLLRRLPKKPLSVYAALVLSMLLGRLAWGAAEFVLLQIDGQLFTLSLFLTGAVVSAVPGIVLHIALIPAIVFTLDKAGLLLISVDAKPEART